jgi:LysR family transcriptional regulator, cys regulon transcriptional activator
VLAIVDNELNITAAANRLYTGQPGVSRQLKLLEEELGLQLFMRNGKSLSEVTSAGSEIIDRARVIIREVDNLLALKHESTVSRSNNVRPASIKRVCAMT